MLYKKPRKFKKSGGVAKSVRKIAIGALVLMAIIIIVGIIYIWYSGQNIDVSNFKDPVTVTPRAPLIKRASEGDNIRVGVSVQNIDSPVARGSDASMTVKTIEYAQCNIVAVYNQVPSKDPGLIAKTSDDYGMVTWNWTVEPTAPVGKWPVTVTCMRNDKSGVVSGSLEVK